MRKLGHALVAALLMVSAVNVGASTVVSSSKEVGAPGQTSLMDTCYYYHNGYWISYPC